MDRSPRSERPSVAPESSPISSSAESSRDVAQEDFLFHLYRGSELLQESRVLEAKEELEFAMTMQPLDPKGQDLLGAVYFRLGLYPRAIQIYEDLGARFPRDAAIKINLALAYLKTGQPQPARRVLEEIVHLYPDHKRAWGYLGLALQKLGAFEQAQVAFQRSGHELMAKRMTERHLLTLPPDPDAISPAEPPAALAGGAIVADIDTRDMRFVLDESESPAQGPWHPHEPGSAPVRRQPSGSPGQAATPSTQVDAHNRVGSAERPRSCSHASGMACRHERGLARERGAPGASHRRAGLRHPPRRHARLHGLAPGASDASANARRRHERSPRRRGQPILPHRRRRAHGPRPAAGPEALHHHADRRARILVRWVRRRWLVASSSPSDMKTGD